jgi:hypothetical protein
MFLHARRLVREKYRRSDAFIFTDIQPPLSGMIITKISLINH